EAKELAVIIKSEEGLRKFIDSPIISAKEKKDVLGKIFNEQIGEELMNFLCVLIDKGRTRHFNKIVKTMQQLSRETEGTSVGIIYSTEMITNEQLEKFQEQTGKLLRTKVKLENQVDKSLLGGIKILIDGKVIDASFKKRIADIKEALK
ncbi:MAG: ATP synthase F1 subunit delta, partial [Peptostreptococcaceae bacterium]|nr:ATP synthase F1 subunit delta [Peptostreptococcaceae bacterium]